VKIGRSVVVVLVVIFAVGLMGSALAGGSAEQPPQVKGKIIKNGKPNGTNNVLPGFLPGPREAAVAPSTLPFTGADVTLFVVAGVVMVAAGAALVRRSRASEPGSS
jgi:LPXTG-motif cell wall-anchored protein